MAIISIPSSIGGVTIPGALVKGPLGALFGNTNSLNFYQYPRDLSSATRGHVVQFTIYEVKEAQYSESTTYEGNDFGGKLENMVTNAITSISDTFKNVNLTLDRRTEKAVESISLYMPETMAFSYNASYGDTSLLDAAKSIAGGMSGVKGKDGKDASVSDKLKSKFGGLGKGISKAISASESGVAKLGLQTQGLAINPQKQLLFDGIGFREYQLMFTFTPYSRDEAQQVENIIKTFKKHAAPRITDSKAGMFFVIPSTFQPKFVFNGAENTKISKVARSVLTNVDVNYAPNPNWATHSDGAPVQTMLTLTFKEIELIDRKKIEEGY